MINYHGGRQEVSLDLLNQLVNRDDFKNNLRCDVYKTLDVNNITYVKHYNINSVGGSYNNILMDIPYLNEVVTVSRVSNLVNFFSEEMVCDYNFRTFSDGLVSIIKTSFEKIRTKTSTDKELSVVFEDFVHSCYLSTDNYYMDNYGIINTDDYIRLIIKTRYLIVDKENVLVTPGIRML